MCLGCWETEGRPFYASPAAQSLAAKFAEADKFGGLHIVVEDWNLEDHSIDFCIASHDPTLTTKELELALSLKKLTWEERWATAILSDYPDFSPEQRTPKCTA